MKKAFIIGAGGHGAVIASIIHNDFDEIKYVDIHPDEETISEDRFFENAAAYLGDAIFIGIGDNFIRSKVYEKLKKAGLSVASCISKSAFVAADAVLGMGVVISHGAVIGARAVIGNNTIINTLSSVDHHCKIGSNTHITAGVTLTGNTCVGDNCFFGVKSATVPGVTIGDNSIVMAGSIIYKTVPANVMVEGNPARVIKNIHL